MLFRIVLFFCLAFGGWQSGFASVMRIADGDCIGLSAAVATAAQNATTASAATILLAPGGNYSGCSFKMGTGNLVIDGQGAHLHRFSACLVQDYLIPNPTPQAILLPLPSLELRNLAITDGAAQSSTCWILVGDMNPIFPTHYVFTNAGSLTLDKVTIGPISASGDGVIISGGNLVLRNVSVIDVRVNASPLWASFGGPSGSLIQNLGILEIYNSTFAGDAAQLGGETISLFDLNSYGSALNSKITIGNSLFSSNTGTLCNASQQGSLAGQFKSLGGNVVQDASCAFSASIGDKIVNDVSLGSFGDHGGLIPTQAINGGSPAKGAGVAQYCEAVDARGYTRSPHGCDAGAYEYGGGSGALTASGLNGFYFDPDANGHYVSLQRIHDNGDIAIVWSTFDANGNPAWVYGVGQLAGKRIHAAMSQNLGGVLQPGGAPTGSSVHPWGTVDIDLTSCALAQFSYASAVPGFGSGAFPLTRLAFVSDFGCSD